MKKRSASWIIIGALALLSGLSIYLYFSKSKFSTVNQDDRAFAFKDTAAITKIFIADKDHHQSTIVRTKKGWVVNNRFNCRSDAILNLLEVIKQVQVKMPVQKAGRENVIKFMSFNAIKVEIYAGDDLVKQYYVGHETEDGEGSFMILTDLRSGKNFADPFVCFIPGFNGYLQPRYIADENDWRDRIVMNYIPPEIKQIKVEQPGTPADSSFSIDLINANTFALKDLSGKQQNFDDAKLRQYLVYYQNLSYETLVTGRNRRLTDSLSMQRPFQIITIQRKDGKEDVFKFYRKHYDGGFSNDMSVRFAYDPDRFYMTFDGGRQWALAQYYVFGKLCVNTAYFRPENSVKK
jgi:hypothetical protein